MPASALPEPQECVQPSVPCPVLRNRLALGAADQWHIAGRGRAQAGPELGARGIALRAGEELLDAAHDGLAAHLVEGGRNR